MKEFPEELISEISKVPQGTVAPTEIRDLVRKTFVAWDMTARFLAVALGNIVKNIKGIPKYGNSEIEKAGKVVIKQYNAPKVKLFRNLIEHEQDYIVGSQDMRPETTTYIKNLNIGIQGTFGPPSKRES